MYRDGANYKQYSEVILSNKNEIPIEEIRKKISLSLNDGEYFIPEDWNLPKLHLFEFDVEIDHEFHEFLDVKETNLMPDYDKDINDLTKII